MCLAAVPFLAGAIGTGIQVSSGLQQAKTSEQIADRNAKMQQAQGRYAAQQIGRKLNYTQSQAKVNASANGVALSGSFLDVLATNEVQGRIDQENTVRNANNQAASTRFEGKAAANRAKNGAVGQLISGIGQAASSYSQNPFLKAA